MSDLVIGTGEAAFHLVLRGGRNFWKFVPKLQGSWLGSRGAKRTKGKKDLLVSLSSGGERFLHGGPDARSTQGQLDRCNRRQLAIDTRECRILAAQALHHHQDI